MPETPPEQGTNARSPSPLRYPAGKVLVVLGALLFALGWFAFPLPPRSPDSAPPPGSPPHLLIEQVDALTTDSTGRPYRRLRAEAMRRSTPNAKSLLVRPRLTMFSTAGPIWHFKAETGEVTPDGKNIYLPGPVHGRRDAVEPLEIDGRDLRIVADGNFGESDAPATIRGAVFEARGTGMRIWLEEGRIELLSDASGVLNPR